MLEFTFYPRPAIYIAMILSRLKQAEYSFSFPLPSSLPLKPPDDIFFRVQLDHYADKSQLGLLENYMKYLKEHHKIIILLRIQQIRNVTTYLLVYSYCHFHPPHPPIFISNNLTWSSSDFKLRSANASPSCLWVCTIWKSWVDNV